MAWRLALGLACSLDQIPRTHQVARCGLRLTDTEARREFSVQYSVSEIDIAGSIEPLENVAVDLVAAAMAETHQVQRRRRRQFEIRRLHHPARELLGEVHVFTDVVLQPLDAIMANDKPQLQRAKTPAEWNMPIAIIDHRAEEVPR